MNEKEVYYLIQSTYANGPWCDGLTIYISMDKAQEVLASLRLHAITLGPDDPSAMLHRLVKITRKVIA